MLTSRLLAIVLAAWAAQAANGVPPRIEAFLKVCEESRRGAIMDVEHKLRGLESANPKSPQTKRQIASLQEDLRLLRSPKEPVVPPLRFPPEVGAIGRLPQLNCHIERIISANEMLVRCHFPDRVVSVKQFQARSEKVAREVLLVVQGTPTQVVQVGADVQMLAVFEVTGRKAFRTASGQSISVPVVSEFDMKSVLPYFQAALGR